MRNDDHNPFHIIENGFDMMVNMAAFYASYIIIIAFGMPAAVHIEATNTMLLLFSLIVISSFVYQFYNLYKPIPYIGTRYSLSPIIFANLTFFVPALLFVSIFSSGIKRDFLLVWLLTTAVVSTLTLLLKKRFIIFVVRLSRKQRDIVKKVIIVGDNRDSARSFVKEVIKDKHNGIMVLGCVGRTLTSDTGCERLGDFEDLSDILDSYKPDYVVFAVESYRKHSLVKMVNMCDDRCIKVFFLPVIYGFFKSSKQIDKVGTIPLINVHSTPLDSRFNAFLKRTVDIVGSLALIVLTSPIMLAAIIGVKLSSPGPILFKQVRVGCMGKKFKMLKFRSMRVNDSSTTAWTTGNDPRKTKFGTFMRKTAIDELPQLFNVLKGDMSLVGPRPEIPFYVDYFKERVPLYMVKHYVKPGITGLAQINGFRGDTSIEERIHADISYLENWSLGLDIYVLLKTPFKAFNKNEKFNDSGKDEADDHSSYNLVVENLDGTVTLVNPDGIEPLRLEEEMDEMMRSRNDNGEE